MANTFLVSKDGGDIHELPDTPENREGAEAKGYQTYMGFTKDGKDVHYLPATNENVQGALKKGYVDVDAFKNRQALQSKPRQVSGLEAGARGIASGMTGGFNDELAGGVQALGDLAAGNTDFTANYRKHRDDIRQDNALAAGQHPWVYAGGQLAGGLIPGAAGAMGAGLKGAIASGAAMGLGGSDADLTKGDVSGATKDAAIGAGVGAAGYGVVKAAGSLFNGDAARTIGAMKQGAEEAKDAASSIPGVRQAQEMWGAVKGVAEQAKVNGEFQGLANQAMKVLHGGEAGMVGNPNADEAVLAALMKDGDNPVKQWFAQKSAMLNPGAGSSEDYLRLLNMPAEARTAARGFVPRDAAAELKPDVERVQELFGKARADRFGQLQNEARQTFEPASVGGVLEELGGAAEDAKLPIINSKARNAIDSAQKMINEGIGLRSHGLTEGALDEVPHEEVFNRLQKARELISNNVDWSAAQGDNESATLLKGVRAKIDAALKTSPEKIEADKLYSAGKDVENNFFKATEFRNPGGQVDVDEGKIARLLGGSDQARRFQESLKQAREYANNPGLSEEFRNEMSALADRMEQKIGIANDKRALDSFRYKQGPSSPAIERLQSATKNNSLLSDAANAPAGFLNQMDEFQKFVTQKSGVPYQQLPPDKQVAVAKFWTWLKNNQGAGQATVNKAWGRLVKP